MSAPIALPQKLELAVQTGGELVTRPTPSPEGPRLRRPVRRRHRVIRASFVLLVLGPLVAAAAYLWLVAADQYRAVTAFSVRSEEVRSPLEALGAFTQVGGSSASDIHILYDYITAQPMVEALDRSLDLRTLFAGNPDDFVFALQDDASIEDLVDYWQRMARVTIDPASGVLTVEIKAFSPVSAQQLAEAVVAESGRLVDELARVARDDAMRFASAEVAEAEAKLKAARIEMLGFRTANDTIDPGAAVDSQMGVIGALQNQLAEALVERGTLLTYADEGDHRVKAVDARIAAIRAQIESEQQLVSGTASDAATLADMMGRYEALKVDLEFAQTNYTAALASAEQAAAEARRKSRYLALHIPPTLAEDSLFPRRGFLTFAVFLTALALWSSAVLVYYNIRDRS